MNNNLSSVFRGKIKDFSGCTSQDYTNIGHIILFSDYIESCKNLKFYRSDSIANSF